MSNYQSLQKDNDEYDHEEQEIIEDSGENVELISNSSGVEEVENLHHHKRVKDYCEMSRGTPDLKENYRFKLKLFSNMLEIFVIHFTITRNLSISSASDII